MYSELENPTKEREEAEPTPDSDTRQDEETTPMVGLGIRIEVEGDDGHRDVLSSDNGAIYPSFLQVFEDLLHLQPLTLQYRIRHLFQSPLRPPFVIASTATIANASSRSIATIPAKTNLSPLVSFGNLMFLLPALVSQGHRSQPEAELISVDSGIDGSNDVTGAVAVGPAYGWVAPRKEKEAGHDRGGKVPLFCCCDCYGDDARR